MKLTKAFLLLQLLIRFQFLTTKCSNKILIDDKNLISLHYNSNTIRPVSNLAWILEQTLFLLSLLYPNFKYTDFKISMYLYISLLHMKLLLKLT